MASVGIVGSSQGTALQEMLLSDDIVPGQDASYQLCKTIYTYHPLGAKMVESPIRMAQFKPRMITVPGAPEERVVKAFYDEWKNMKAEDLILQTGTLARVYGIASLAYKTKDEKFSEPLNFKKIAKAEISFSVFDPLNTSGSLVLNQLPNDMDFLKITGITVQGEAYHRSRTVSLLNEQPIYLAYTDSAFGYVGRSVYQRVLLPLKSYIQTMITNDLVSLKAGLLIAKQKQAGSVVDNVMQWAAGIKRNFLKEGRTGNVLSIAIEEDIESLNLNNIKDAIEPSRKFILEDIAVGADMPAKLLNAETFVEGFGEGTEDAKNVARYVDRIRAELEPLYKFMTKICQYRAWNEEFYKTIQADFPDYAKKDYNEAFYEWINAFQAEWPSLLTEPESELAKVDDAKMKAIIAMIEVLIPEMDPENKSLVIKWACDNFNELKRLFPIPLELDWEALKDFKPEPAVGTQGDMGGGGLKEQQPAPPFSGRDASSVRSMIEDILDRDPKTRIKLAS